MQDKETGDFMTERTFAHTSFSLGKNDLAKIRIKAIRRGIWFRALTKAERAQMELTMRLVKKIRSLFLARVLDAIIKKLLDAMESKFARLMRKVGRVLAENLSRIAQNWGNKSAHHWKEDPNFVQYLAITHMNIF
jgi:hypothetical protein